MMMMMCSRLRPTLPHLWSLRFVGSAAASRTVAAVKQPGVLSTTLSFEDPSAFRVKSFGELLRALGIFRLCSFPVLINNCGKVRIEFIIIMIIKYSESSMEKYILIFS